MGAITAGQGVWPPARANTKPASRVPLSAAGYGVNERIKGRTARR